MNSMTFSHLCIAAIAVIATGCIKDGILPPKPFSEGKVSLDVELVNGVHSFAPGMWSEDGTGARVQFTTLKFYMSGISLLDTDSNRITGVSNTELLVDASGAAPTYALGSIPNGHIEEFQFTPGLDRTFNCEEAYPHGHPFMDPAMQDLEEYGRLHLLMRGYVDVDTNGQFDEGVDSEFDYRLVAGTARPSRHFHMHADMIDGQDLTLGIRVDVRILLLAVDLRANATVDGNAELSDLLLDNLSVAVSPR